MRTNNKYTSKAINSHNKQYVKVFFVYIDIKKKLPFYDAFCYNTFRLWGLIS